ncbi:MAG: fibronectin type III domain-containing protein [Brevinema sp.]
MKKLLLSIISLFLFLACSKTYLEETKDVVHIKASTSSDIRTDGVLLFWETYWEFANYSIIRSSRLTNLSGRGREYLLKDNLIKDSYLDISAISGQDLYYKVLAYNKKGRLIGESDILKGFRKFPTISTVSPPQNITISDNEFTDRIELYWISAANDSLTRIYRRSNPNQSFIPIADLQDRSYIDKNVEPNIVYTYKLSHLGLDSNGQLQEFFSSEHSAQTLLYPNNISVSEYYTGDDGKGAGTILVQWEKNPKVDIYRIYRSENNKDFSVILPSTTKSYFLDSNLPHIIRGDNTYPSYYYKIQALKNGSGSILSDSYSGIALLEKDLLPKPNSASGSKLLSSWKVNWSAVAGAEGYRVYRKRNGDHQWFDSCPVNGESISYNARTDEFIKNTPSGTDIIFEIRAMKNKRPVGIPINTSINK